MKENKSLKFLMAFIVILALIMIYAVIRILPGLINFSVETYREVAYLAKPVGLIVVLSAIPFYIVLIETLLLGKYILNDDIFTEKPLKALNKITVSSLLICILFIIILILFLYNNFFTPLLGIILFLVILSSLVIGIFSKIFYILVKKATVLKIDSDLTI